MPVQTQSSAPPPVRPAEGSFEFLSSLLGSRVIGPSGERLGTLVDLLADASEAYPPVRGLRVRPSRGAELKAGRSSI